MKKYLFLLLVFVGYLIINFNVSATTYYYEWENTVINIPVYSSIDGYKNIPKAHLYVDGIEVECDLKYNIEGDWLYYLSNVNTSKVGSYKVWYKVYENRLYKPGTCKGYKSLITFNVVDIEPPIVEVYKNIVDVRRGNNYDLNKNIYVYDNYDSKVDVTFLHDINYLNNGEYDVEVVVVDDHDNKSKSQFIVRVYSEEPYITFNSDKIVVGVNEDVDLSTYFKAYDIVDGDISNKIIYPSIDTTKVSIDKYYVELIHNGFIVKKEFEVKVTDDKPAEIILVYDNVILDYKIDFETFDFSKYILSINDNKEIKYSNLSIVHNIENKVGQYIVKYIYDDETFITNKNLNVKLLSFELPVVEVEDIKLNVGEYVILEEYVSVYDESDPLIRKTLRVNADTIDFNTPGVYYAEVYVMNSSGESVIKKMRVTINDIEESAFNPAIIYIAVIVGLISILIIILVKRKKKEKE